MAELPNVTIEGWWCSAHLVDAHGSSPHRPMQEDDLVALLAALPDEQRARLLDTVWAPKREWVQGEEDGHYACSRCGTNLDDRDEEDGEHTRAECDAEVAGWEGYSSHFIFEENKRLTGEVESERAARLLAERDGMLKAYEHVADNLTLSKFALRGLGMDDGSTALTIARSVVYKCREFVLKPPKPGTGNSGETP